MKKKFGIFLALIFSLASLPAEAAQKLKVVATSTTFADLVKTIGGDAVDVQAIASSKLNIHFIEPRPTDVARLARADLFVHAGLDFELWRTPLLEAAGNSKLFTGQVGELDLSKGVPLLEISDRPLSRVLGDIHIYGNPHYWLDPKRAKIIVENITQKLSEMIPQHKELFQKNRDEFLSQLDEKIQQWKQRLRALQGKECVAYHNSWPYFAEFAGIRIRQFVEPKPGIPPTPKHLAFLEEWMRGNKASLIITETYYSDRAVQQLAEKTEARVVILYQQVGQGAEAKDYISLVEYNIDQLVQ